MSKDVFILGGKRTAMADYVGALKDISAIDLGAVAAKGALESSGVAPEGALRKTSSTPLTIELLRQQNLIRVRPAETIRRVRQHRLYVS